MKHCPCCKMPRILAVKLFFSCHMGIWGCVFPTCEQSYLVHSYLKVLNSFEMKFVNSHLVYIFLLGRVVRRAEREPVGFVGPHITAFSHYWQM